MLLFSFCIFCCFAASVVVVVLSSAYMLVVDVAVVVPYTCCGHLFIMSRTYWVTVIGLCSPSGIRSFTELIKNLSSWLSEHLPISTTPLLTLPERFIWKKHNVWVNYECVYLHDVFWWIAFCFNLQIVFLWWMTIFTWIVILWWALLHLSYEKYLHGELPFFIQK